jgi:hypothetical protein
MNGLSRKRASAAAFVVSSVFASLTLLVFPEKFGQNRPARDFVKEFRLSLPMPSDYNNRRSER